MTAPAEGSAQGSPDRGPQRGGCVAPVLPVGEPPQWCAAPYLQRKRQLGSRGRDLHLALGDAELRQRLVAMTEALDEGAEIG